MGLARVPSSYLLAEAITSRPTERSNPNSGPFFTAVWRRCRQRALFLHSRGPEGWGHLLGGPRMPGGSIPSSKKCDQGTCQSCHHASPLRLVRLPMLPPLNCPFPMSLLTTTNLGYQTLAKPPQPRPTKTHGPSFSGADIGLAGGQGGKGDVQ